LAGTTLSRLAVKAAIAAVFLTGIGVAFLDGYEGYTRVHEDPAPAGPAAIAAPAQRSVWPAVVVDPSDIYNPPGVPVSYQAPPAVHRKARHAEVRTATPAVSPAPTWQAWAPHASPAVVPPRYPAVRTQVPAAQRNISVPASYAAPGWPGQSPAGPYGYAPAGFSPAPMALPPRRSGNRPKGCGFGFG